MIPQIALEMANLRSVPAQYYLMQCPYGSLSYGAAAHPSSLPYHTWSRHPMHYTLPATPLQTAVPPIGYRQASLPPWQNRTRILSWQDYGIIPPLQGRAIPPETPHATIPPQYYHTNIPLQYYDQHNRIVIEGEFDNPTSISYYVEEARPQPSDDVVAEEDELQQQLSDDVETEVTMTQYGGTPTAELLIESLPSVVVASGVEVADCSICMSEMCTQDGGDVTKLPCGHLFHRDCIVLWLCNHNTCPICRLKLPTDE
jgi:Ring finger domain